MLDDTAPAFLGAQAVIGRWTEQDHILKPPASECVVTRFPVVASDKQKLKHAIDEQQALVDKYGQSCNAHKVQANHAEVDPFLLDDPVGGTAIHFAVHGLSDPDANRQQLILEDKPAILPSFLGDFCCGETPKFSFVFLNACQVGQPGKELGDMAGFPGSFVATGCLGIIAPLWDVKDEVAYALAVGFYRLVFEEQVPVAEALRRHRATYDKAGHSTPLAYVYYGHPGLKLTPGANHGD